MGKTDDDQMAYAETLIKEHGMLPDIAYIRALYLLDKARVPEAVKLIDQAMFIDSEHALCKSLNEKIKIIRKAEFEGAKCLEGLNGESAVRAFTKGIEEGNNEYRHINAIFYSCRAAAYMQILENVKALIEINKALEIQPETTKFIILKGRILYKLDRYDEAVVEFNRALEKEPDNATCKRLRMFAEEKSPEYRDFYFILALEKDADPDAVKTNYIRKLRRWKPEFNTNGTEEEQREAMKNFVNITSAFYVFCNEGRRKIYDEKGDVPELFQNSFDPNDILQKFIKFLKDEPEEIEYLNTPAEGIFDYDY